MKLDKQQIIIIALSTVIICGFGVFQYIPLLRQKQAIRERIGQQDLVFQDISSQSALLPELEQQKEQIEEALAPFTKKIPLDRNFAQLWQQIADVMNECNLTEQLVQPGEDLRSDQLCSIPLTFECRGSLEQLFAFFQAMEKMDRLIRIDMATFENDSDFDPIVKLIAKANVYYQPDNRDNS